MFEARPSSIALSQLSSTPLQVSTAPGFTAASVSLQSTSSAYPSPSASEMQSKFSAPGVPYSSKVVADVSYHRQVSLGVPAPVLLPLVTHQLPRVSLSVAVCRSGSRPIEKRTLLAQPTA